VGAEFEQVAPAVAVLGRHLTTWSPELLAYSVGEMSVARYDEPYDADNWLPPLDDDDEQPRPHWPPETLLDINPGDEDAIPIGADAALSSRI
jgi:hypothetical protein